jgi:hypothetical protein
MVEEAEQEARQTKHVTVSETRRVGLQKCAGHVHFRCLTTCPLFGLLSVKILKLYICLRITFVLHTHKIELILVPVTCLLRYFRPSCRFAHNNSINGKHGDSSFRRKPN